MLFGRCALKSLGAFTFQAFSGINIVRRVANSFFCNTRFWLGQGLSLAKLTKTHFLYFDCALHSDGIGNVS